MFHAPHQAVADLPARGQAIAPAARSRRKLGQGVRNPALPCIQRGVGQPDILLWPLTQRRRLVRPGSRVEHDAEHLVDPVIVCMVRPHLFVSLAGYTATPGLVAQQAARLLDDLAILVHHGMLAIH